MKVIEEVGKKQFVPVSLIMENKDELSEVATILSERIGKTGAINRCCDSLLHLLDKYQILDKYQMIL